MRGGLRTLGITSLVVALATSALAAPSKETRGDKHKPPYKAGPTGGDDFNHTEADRESGTISIFRVFPFPGSFGCIPESEAAWATFQVVHKVTEPVATVKVNYEEAWLDGYAWITLRARGEGDKWLGSKDRQGPLTGGSGALKLSLGKRAPGGGRIVIQFGLQVSSACPQVAGAHVSFPAVEVK